MSNAFLGEIKTFAFGFPPRGWALCNGQLLSINTNAALFSLLGTTYGGNGTTNFALPDLRGKTPIGFAQGPGLPNVIQGETGGTEGETLSVTQIPAHVHQLAGTSAAGTKRVVNGSLFATQTTTLPGVAFYGPVAAAPVPLAPNSVAASGSTQPHSNMQPYSTTNFCIATSGIYPSRN